MPRATLKCYTCKEEFRREELVSYASPNSTVSHNYCPKCLKERQSKDYFSQRVCEIFKLKSPGPRIWKERQRIQDKFGYSDEVIADCLDYIYNVEKYKVYSESISLVAPDMVERMKKYKREQQQKKVLEEQRNKNIVQAIAQSKFKEYVVPVQENTKVYESKWNPDDWLDID